MMLGLEYPLNSNVIAVAHGSMAPREDAERPTPARILEFESRVVVASVRGGLLQGRGRTLQRDGLVIEVRRFSNNRADADVRSISKRR